MHYSLFKTAFGYLILIAIHHISFAQAVTNNGKVPKYIYLTWQGNTSSTMTINYHTDDSTSSTTVYYGKQTLSSTKKCRLKKQNGYSFRIDSIHHRFMHVVELTDLDPGVTYYFVVGDSLDGLSSERKFKTIPKNPHSLSFVVGGDMGYEPVVTTMMQSAAKKHPDFVFIGGDIAYEDGNINNLPLVDLWFNRWCQFMITDDGYTIPLVTCIGNHEVKGSFAKSPSAAPFYFKFFTQKRNNSLLS